MEGYAGKILRVDLTKKKVWEEVPNEEELRRFVGGRGLGVKILYQELKSKIDPLSKDNILIFMTGPLAGTDIPGSSRYAVMAKSPLTGGWGEATVGGYFGRELKLAGYDGIVIEGRSENPVYLWIRDGKTQLKDAAKFWGKETGETEDLIKKELNDKRIKVACIGPAGERLIKYACILSDRRRTAGRTGMGAVMGSKNLKAIAIRGEKTIEIYNKNHLKKVNSEVVKILRNNPINESRKRYGTARGINSLNELGILPTKNFQTGVFPQHDQISGETMANTILKKRWACHACPCPCGRVVEVKKGPFAPVDPEYGGPEYETIAALGSLCMNRNLESIAKANELCNRYGLDTISTGVCLAFALECFEKGLLSKEDTGGIELTWGNSQAIVEMVHQIANQQGLGGILSEGVRRVAAKIGRGAEEFAMEIKGLEVPLHEPRGKKGQALSYATSERGACHLQAPHDQSFAQKDAIPELGFTEIVNPLTLSDKAEFVKKGQDFWSALDVIGMCKFLIVPQGGMTVTQLLELIYGVTGWRLTPTEFLAIGERAINLSRLFNKREGIGREEDRLPKRFFTPLPEGGSKGNFVDPQEFEETLRKYYLLRGWDPEKGIPTKEKLKELGIEGI